MWETWVRSLGCEDPWRREWLPTPVYGAGEFRGLYSPRGCKEQNTTEKISVTMYKINNKDLLYCKGDYIPYLIIIYNGEDSEKEYIYIYTEQIQLHRYRHISVIYCIPERNTALKIHYRSIKWLLKIFQYLFTDSLFNHFSKYWDSVDTFLENITQQSSTFVMKYVKYAYLRLLIHKCLFI